MTTTQRTPWSPYDDEIAASTDPVTVYQLQAKREGYLRKAAEDAPLLEALEAVRKAVAPHEHEEAWQMVTAVRNILQAEKGGQQ